MLYYKALPTKTVSDALYSQSPSLSVIKKEMGDEKTKAFLSVIITDLVMSFNIGKTMNTNQVAETVILIQSNYYFLKPSELKYCFDNAKMGRYGQLYDRIDSSIIFDWIEKYLEERMETCVSENQKQNYEFNSILVHENVLKAIRMGLEKPKEEPKEFVIQTDEQRELCNQIFLEFDKIFGLAEVQGKKFIDYNGKILDIDEFLKIRLTEITKK